MNSDRTYVPPQTFTKAQQERAEALAPTYWTLTPTDPEIVRQVLGCARRDDIFARLRQD